MEVTNMKKLVAMLLCLVMAMSLCLSAASAEETVTLRFSWWGGEERLAATLEVIEQFEALYPNIKIEAEYGSSDGYNDRLANQLAGGTAPDIIQIDPGLFPSYISDETNYFINYDEYGFDFSQFEESYIHARINGYYDGRQLGIPTGISGGATLVNKTLADTIGIDFKTQYTWDDLFTWAKQVREYDNSMYLLSSNKTYLSNIVLNNYLKQMTGKMWCDEETKTLNYTAEELEAGYAFIKRLFDEEVVAPASYMAAYDGDNLQSDPNWIAGKYVAAITHSSLVDIISAANTSVEYTAGLFAKMEGSDVDAWNANCPQVITINSRSAHIEEALKFVDYFFNNETAMETLGCVRSVPPTARARELAAQSGKMSNLLRESADVCAMYSGMIDDKYYATNEGRQIVIDQVEALGYGVTTPAQAAADTISLMENFLANQ